jgi:hypothetical protein
MILYSADGSSEKNGLEYSGGVSEDSGVNLRSSDQQRLGVGESSGNGKSSGESFGTEYLSPGYDVSGSGILTWSLFPKNSNEFLLSLFLLITF